MGQGSPYPRLYPKEPLNWPSPGPTTTKVYDYCDQFIVPLRLEVLLNKHMNQNIVMPQCGWSPDVHSPNIRLDETDPLTVHRIPSPQTTDGIRGKVGFTKGIHMWRIIWDARHRGTNATVGVGTVEAPVFVEGYQSLIGSNDQSWGWDLGRNMLYHNGKINSGRRYPFNLDPEEMFEVPNEFMMALDMDAGTLSFVVEGHYLGIAFACLHNKKLYPMIGTVWGHCSVTMKYLGGLSNDPLSLEEICRYQVRKAIKKDRITDAEEELELPESIKSSLLAN